MSGGLNPTVLEVLAPRGPGGLATQVADLSPTEVSALADKVLPGAGLPSVPKADKTIWYGSSGWVLGRKSPKASDMHILDAADALLGLGNWSTRTYYAPDGTGSKGTDFGAVARYGFQQLRSRVGRGRLYVPAALNISIQTQVPDTDQNGHEWVGDGKGKSQIYLDLGDVGFGAMFWASNTAYSTYSGARGGFTIYLGYDPAWSADSNISLLHLAGDATFQPDGAYYEHIRSTYEVGPGGAHRWWYNGINAVGTARTSDPQGIRAPTFTDFDIFGCRNSSLSFYNVIQALMDGLGTYVGKPASTGLNVYLGGTGSPSGNTQQIDMRNLYCGGELNLTNATSCKVRGRVGTIVADTSFNEYSLDIDGPNGLTSGSLGPIGFARIGNVTYKNGSIVL